VDKSTGTSAAPPMIIESIVRSEELKRWLEIGLVEIL
jgi:hypothetical protein